MPNEQNFKRKLTAILSADAVGYSRLMADDETATVKTIASYREIMATLIKQHRGRVVDSPGDNLLAEFSSVVDAVQCAVAVQSELETRNAELAENRRMEFRIGINLGDVIDEENRIYGDGVNIAARLEALADPAGICVSKTAFDQIETKLPLGYEYLGEQSIKNIPKPVGAYRVLMKPDAAGKVIGEKRFLGRFSRKTAMVAIIALFIVAGGLIGWNIYLQQSNKVEPASVENMAFPLPEKPSIAVLAFENMSEDPKQEYFSDGITEEIITSLSKVPQLLVIARNSTFTYKGKAVKVQQVAEELGVQYVLEGSVRKSGDKVRVTTQLIDALTGHHLWAERYDRNVKDIFAVQDEITMKILTELHVKLTDGEFARLYARGTENLQAYMKVLEGHQYKQRNNKEDNAVAKRLYQEAVDLDPNYAAAYMSLGIAHVLDVFLGATKSPKDSLLHAMKLTKNAIKLDNALTQAHGQLGLLLLMFRQHDKAIALVERASSLDPSNSKILLWLGMSLNFSGRPEEGYPVLRKAIRINPLFPNYYHHFGIACAQTGRYEEGIAAQKKALQLAPDDTLAYRVLVLIYISAGREDEAIAAAEEVLRREPNYLFVKGLKRNPFKDQAYVEYLTDLYHKAGLK
jgi:adenylate cyclase